MNKIVKKWADDNNVSTVNRSYGEQTTTPVTVAALENLVSAAIQAERAACAKVCDDYSKQRDITDFQRHSAGQMRDAIKARSNQAWATLEGEP